jgi:RNA polymerase sigma factor (TIGR02999 family)
MTIESVPQLLLRWRNGDQSARDNLFEIMYEDMKRSATAVLRKRWSKSSLQPTELVNEAYLKLAGLNELDWQDRSHFLAMSATVMRQFLIDQHRREFADKRSHDKITLLTNHLGESTSVNFGQLNDALGELAAISSEYGRVVEMKFFAGMTHEEIAQVMGVSETTVKRQWRGARAWLESYLKETGDE